MQLGVPRPAPSGSGRAIRLQDAQHDRTLPNTLPRCSGAFLEAPGVHGEAAAAASTNLVGTLCKPWPNLVLYPLAQARCSSPAYQAEVRCALRSRMLWPSMLERK
jgi:hypothetical protein